STGNSIIISATAITTVTNNAAVLMLAWTQENLTITSFSTTSPGPLGELYGDVSNSNEEVAAAWSAQATAGSTGTGTATISGSSNRLWAVILLALRAQPTASPTATATATAKSTQGPVFQRKVTGITIPMRGAFKPDRSDARYILRPRRSPSSSNPAAAIRPIRWLRS